ncbi:MAG: LacI family DNA-binding transcriptional regulator [Chthoniobacteraceae bacterium]
MAKAPTDPPPRITTLRELATALNVSVATVSMALHNNPEIAQETRRRIQAFAMENGYRLNPSITTFMSQIRAGHTVAYRETLGWINAFGREDYFVGEESGTPPFFRGVWKSAFERAGQLGYQLEPFWLKAPGMSGRRMSAILKARGIRGLLIPPIPYLHGHLSLDWSAFAVTAISYTLARPYVHRVELDHHHNMRMALHKLHHRGYKRIGLLTAHDFDKRTHQRPLSAFYYYQHGIPARHRVPVLACRDDALGKQCAAWLKKHRPDAVIMMGICRDLREIDIGDPTYSKNLGMALMGGNLASSPGFAGVDENHFLFGPTAVDHLAAQLNRNERGIPDFPQTVLIKGVWVEGQTLAKERAR